MSSALIERQVAPEKVLRLTNRQRTCTVDTTLPKKLKRKQSKSKESSGDLVEHSASPPKRSKTKKSKTLCVDTPNSNSERPSIRLKLVRQNSTIYNCILLPDVSIQPLDVPKCQIKTRSCSVVIEPLPIKNTVSLIETSVWQSLSIVLMKNLFFLFAKKSPLCYKIYVK